MGIQVAIRKIRPPAPGVTPGAWAGLITKINEGGIFKTVSQVKWDKAKMILRRISDEMDSKPILDFKSLEKDRGFLVYLSGTYKTINPYLKGIHLTLDSWRANRNADGWKMKPKEWIHFLNGIDDPILRDMEQQPERSTPDQTKNEF